MTKSKSFFKIFMAFLVACVFTLGMYFVLGPDKNVQVPTYAAEEEFITPDVTLSDAEDFDINTDGRLSLSHIGKNKIKDVQHFAIVIPAEAKSIKGSVYYSYDIDPVYSSFLDDASISNKLVSLTFAEGSQFTTLGDYCLTECYSLQRLILPDSVTSVTNEICYDSSCALLEFRIPAGIDDSTELEYLLKVIEYNNCLKTITVSESNPTYSDYGCNVIVDNNTKTLIRGCITSVIPEDVTSIAGYAFSNCRGLESINIPENVASIAGSAFGFCDNLKSINIPNSITHLDSYVFERCTNLETIVAGNKDRAELLKTDPSYNLTNFAEKITYPVEIQFKKSESEVETQKKLFNKPVQWCQNENMAWVQDEDYALPGFSEGTVWYDSEGNTVNLEQLNTKLTSGEITETYTLTGKTDISTLGMTYDWTEKSYNGEMQVPNLQTNLVAGQDYAVTYHKDSQSGEVVTEPVDAGTYYAEISGQSQYYHGTVTLNFTITKASNEFLQEFNLNNFKQGQKIAEPTVQAKFGEAKVKYFDASGKEYSFKDLQKAKAGKYKAVVTVDETANYEGLSKEYNFEILKSSSLPWWIWLVIVLCVIAIVSVLLIVIFKKKSEKESENAEEKQ